MLGGRALRAFISFHARSPAQGSAAHRQTGFGALLPSGADCRPELGNIAAAESRAHARVHVQAFAAPPAAGPPYERIDSNRGFSRDLRRTSWSAAMCRPQAGTPTLGLVRTTHQAGPRRAFSLLAKHKLIARPPRHQPKTALQIFIIGRYRAVMRTARCQWRSQCPRTWLPLRLREVLLGTLPN